LPDGGYFFLREIRVNPAGAIFNGTAMSNFIRGQASAHGMPVHVTWAGNPWSLFGLCLLNILLIIITAGIYWFWARTEYRRYMWQMVRINGEPLEYTGKGSEILIGYLKLFLFVLLPVIAIVAGAQLAFGPGSAASAAATFIVYISLFCLYFAGVFRAHRYILSRTRWRGIAFGLGGDARAYAWTSIWTAFLSGLTLGWIWPWRLMALRRRLTSAMSFGSVPFRFEGSSGSLYGAFAFLWLSLVAAYGAIFAIQIAIMRVQMQQPAPQQRLPIRWDTVPHMAVWIILAAIPVILAALSLFEARKLNVFAKSTKISSLAFDLNAGWLSVFWLTFSNLCILILSIGILRPITQARRLRYLVTRLELTGQADLDEVAQGPEQRGSPGAGLEAAFSIEIF
jgi:uncharacterized membrane protein YjgN (DUF898 family)